MFCAWQDRQGFEGAQVGRQCAAGARLLHGIENHALRGKALDQLAQVLLVANVAGAGRVPEMYQADRPRPGQLWWQAKAVAGKKRGLVIERAQVTPLEPVVGEPETGGAKHGAEAGDQGLAAGLGHAGLSESGRVACHACPYR
ncbi:hypothetical protein D9M71_511580 [compost metagenome]